MAEPENLWPNKKPPVEGVEPVEATPQDPHFFDDNDAFLTEFPSDQES